MRKQYWTWSLAVFGIIGTAYGLYSVIDSYSNGKGLSVWGLLLLILGALP